MWLHSKNNRGPTLPFIMQYLHASTHFAGFYNLQYAMTECELCYNLHVFKLILNTDFLLFRLQQNKFGNAVHFFIKSSDWQKCPKVMCILTFCLLLEGNSFGCAILL